MTLFCKLFTCSHSWGRLRSPGRFRVVSAPPADHPKELVTAGEQDLMRKKLSEEIMSTHPELISVTFHGVPPGQNRPAYTMVCRVLSGSHRGMRMILTTSTSVRRASPSSIPAGIETNDTVKKFVMMLPPSRRVRREKCRRRSSLPTKNPGGQRQDGKGFLPRRNAPAGRLDEEDFRPTPRFFSSLPGNGPAVRDG